MASQVELKIFDCLEKRKSFLLDAGAGSGKTWTLVETLNYLIEKKSDSLKKDKQKIACITYTNIAKNEIIERTEFNELIHVSTIHDFLWLCIKNFQIELKKELIHLIIQKLSKVQIDIDKAKSKTTKSYYELIEKKNKFEEALKSLNENNFQIMYSNFPSYKKGRFSHDDLLSISERLFAYYPQLKKIISDSFPYIFVDEYQDTQDKTINILLEYLPRNDKFIIGFFGDKIQRIYEKGVGNISHEKYDLELIQKTENYRSSKEVINLLNNIRDDIKQVQPPMNKRRGQTSFYYLPNALINISSFIDTRLKDSWKIDSLNIKVLFLTHRYIAKENGYEELYQLYADGNDVLIKNEDNRGFSPYTDILFDIEKIVSYYTNDQIQDLLKVLPFSVNSFKRKKKLRELINKLIKLRNDSNIKAVVDYVIKSKMILPSDRLKSFNLDDPNNFAFYKSLMSINYSQFIKFFEVNQDKTPFSTKHNTKGDEFDNVLAIIDDDAWKQKYNFDEYFSNNQKTPNRYELTKNLFYVICSRAKNNLAILTTSELCPESINTVKRLFGNKNYHEN